MRIALCSAVWGRTDLTRVWWNGASRIRQQLRNGGIDCEIFVGGSESAHLLLCYSNKGQWVQVENNPLGAKWNAVVNRALLWGADYIFILGSDDFFNSHLIDQYAGLARQGIPYAGLASMYFFEPASDRLMLLDVRRKARSFITTFPGRRDIRRIRGVEGYQNTPRYQTLGAGRLIHRSFLEGRDHIWEPNKNSALDASMTKTCELPRAFELQVSPQFLAVDVKTDTNIWSFSAMETWFPEQFLSATEILAGLPELEELRQLTSPRS